MKRCFCIWFRYCVLLPSAVLVVCVTLFPEGGLLDVIRKSVQPLAQNVRNCNTVARKLLEKDVQISNTLDGNSSFAQRLPQCIIIGARKCGTRALIEFLKLHPRIFSAQDEVHFFSNDSNYRQGLDWYRHRMPWTQTNEITIEKTPKYLVSSISPPRIHRMNSSIHLLLILRHPTTRLVSDYTQLCAKSRNESFESFESLVINKDTGQVNTEYRGVQTSIYWQHLSTWLQLFPLRQIHIVDGDNLIVNPIAEISKVETFLGLEHAVKADNIYYNTTRGFYCMKSSRGLPDRCLGVSKGRKHTEVPVWLTNKLNRFFKPHNERLYRLIHRRFSWT